MKAADGFTWPLPEAILAVGYVCSFYCLSLAPRTIPMGIAYSIAPHAPAGFQPRGIEKPNHSDANPHRR